MHCPVAQLPAPSESLVIGEERPGGLGPATRRNFRVTIMAVLVGHADKFDPVSVKV